MRRRRRRRTGVDLERSGPWVAVVGVVVLVWLAFSTMIYAPWWGVAIHLLAVVPVAVWVSRWARTRPAASTFVPIAGLPLLAVITAIGVSQGGWSA